MYEDEIKIAPAKARTNIFNKGTFEVNRALLTVQLNKEKHVIKKSIQIYDIGAINIYPTIYICTLCSVRCSLLNEISFIFQIILNIKLKFHYVNRV